MSSGKIGSADLTASITTYSDLTSGGASENKIVNVCFTNRNTAGVTIRLAVGTGANPANTDFMEYGAYIPANGILERTGIAISIGEKIWTSSDTANVSVRAHGIQA